MQPVLAAQLRQGAGPEQIADNANFHRHGQFHRTVTGAVSGAVKVSGVDQKAHQYNRCPSFNFKASTMTR